MAIGNVKVAATAGAGAAADARPIRLKNNLSGIAAVIGAGAAMTSSDACLRVAVREIGLFEAIAGRGMIACLLLTLVALSQRAVWSHPGLASSPTRIRIAGEVGAGLLFNAALQQMPLADATAILQFIPLVTTLVAAWLFAEHVGWQRWLAALAGLVGVSLILKPGTAGFTWWSLLAVAAMLCMSIRDLATSRIDSTTPTLPIGAISAAFAALSGFALLPLGSWSAPTASALGMTCAAALCMAAGFICLVVAMRSAEMSALAPFRYCVILWAILIGILAWGEVPDLFAVTGILIVVIAGLATFVRERRLARAA